MPFYIPIAFLFRFVFQIVFLARAPRRIIAVDREMHINIIEPTIVAQSLYVFVRVAQTSFLISINSNVEHLVAVNGIMFPNASRLT